MSALDEFKKSLGDGMIEVTGTFKEKRAAFINYLYNHKWLIEKECEFLKKNVTPESKDAFAEKGHGWALLDESVNILKKMYQ